MQQILFVNDLPRLKSGLALSLLSKVLFYIRAMNDMQCNSSEYLYVPFFTPLQIDCDQRKLSKRRTSSRERLGGRAVIYHFPPTYHFDQKMKRVGTKGKILRFPAATNEGANRECGCIDKQPIHLSEQPKKSFQGKGPSINYVVGERPGGQLLR